MARWQGPFGKRADDSRELSIWVMSYSAATLTGVWRHERKRIYQPRGAEARAL